MLRFFVRFYLLIIGGLFVIQLLFGLLAGALIEQDVRQDVERAVSGFSVLLKDRFAGVPPAQREPLRRELQPHFPHPLQLVGRDALALTAAEAAQLGRTGYLVRTEVPLMGQIPVSLVVGLDARTALVCVIYSGEEQPAWLTLLPVLTWFLAAALLVFVATYRVYARLARLSRAATRMAEGDLSVRIDAPAGSESQELARSLDLLASRIRALLATQAQFLRLVAHEFRTPMNRIQFRLETIRGPQTQAVIDEVSAELGEMSALVRDVGQYVTLLDSEKPPEPCARFDAAQLCRRLVDAQQETSTLRLELAYQGAPEVVSARRQVAYCLRNLLGNAVRFARTTVRVSVVHEAQCLRIIVDDDGPGIPPGRRDWALQPFNKDADNGGLGLGLALVKRIVDVHLGGEMRLLDSPLGGLRVELAWPLPPATEDDHSDHSDHGDHGDRPRPLP